MILSVNLLHRRERYIDISITAILLTLIEIHHDFQLMYVSSSSGLRLCLIYLNSQ